MEAETVGEIMVEIVLTTETAVQSLCIKRLVINAETHVKCHSGQAAINRFIAMTVSEVKKSLEIIGGGIDFCREVRTLPDQILEVILIKEATTG